MKGSPSLPGVGGFLTLLIGGSVLTVAEFGFSNLPWAGVIVLAGLLLAALEGAHKIGMERDAANEKLAQLRGVPVSEAHRSELNTYLRDLRGALVARTRHTFAPMEARIFSAHFPDLAAIRDEWNRIVDECDHASADLLKRLRSELTSRGLDEHPYQGIAIAGVFHNVILGLAMSGDDDPLGPDVLSSLWDGWQSSDPHIGGHVAFSEERSVAVSMAYVDAETDDQFTDRVATMVRPLNELLCDAQSWPDAQRVRNAVAKLQRPQDDVRASLDHAEIREGLPVVMACPRCGVAQC